MNKKRNTGEFREVKVAHQIDLFVDKNKINRCIQD